MGILLGLTSALFWGMAALLLRVGMRTSPEDDGLYMTFTVNVCVLGAIGLFVSKPEWNAVGVSALAGAGLIGGLGGRYSNFRAIRFVGATRASIFIIGSPLVTAAAGWVILDESLRPVEAAGGLLVLASLALLIGTRSTARGVPGAKAAEHSPMVGYVYAVAAPILIGLAFVLRKWGLRSFDSVVLGAFIGVAAALVLLTVGDVGRGRFRARISDNFDDVNWWFVGAGVILSLALLTQFWAFSFTSAWVVGVLQGTQAIWVLVLSYIFRRGEERIDRIVVASVVVAVVGVTLIAVNV
jgi:drug/metabolite transporter (DMT)-like permease